MNGITNISPAGLAPGSCPAAPQRAPVLVVGLGKDLLSDDGMGLRVPRRLRRRLDPDRFEVVELVVGGADVVERLLGRTHAAVIDACRTGRRPVGTLTRRTHEEFLTSLRTASYHTTVFAIELEDIETIHEGCTPRVEARIEPVAEEIARVLESAHDSVGSRAGSDAGDR